MAGLHDTDQDGVFDLGVGHETPVGISVQFIAISGDSVNGYHHHITSNNPVTMDHYETIPNMLGPITHSVFKQY